MLIFALQMKSAAQVIVVYIMLRGMGIKEFKIFDVLKAVALRKYCGKNLFSLSC